MSGEPRTAQDGFTLPEVLVVLAIIGIVLVGITQLFTSALKSQTDQTNRTQAQQDARLGLDKLRREIRCASALTTPSGYPASSITITLGSYCPTAGGAHDGDVVHEGQERRHTAGCRGAALHALAVHGLGLLGHRDEVGVGSRGQGRRTEHLRRQDLQRRLRSRRRRVTPATTGGTLEAGTYSYEVTAVLAGGEEVPGTVAPVTIASGLTNQITVSWSSYPGATSYNVYGWDDGGLRLLKNVTSGTSYVDTGPTKLTANPLTLPSATITVASTSNFNAGANTIAFGPSGPVTCTGTTSPTRASPAARGGQAGDYPQNTPVYSASSARPPRAALSVSLALDKTPASTSQRFVLLDTIVLRNSQPF